MRTLALVIAAACAVPACVSGPRFNCDPQTASSELHALQCRSARGDKLAQLELGKRYEEGLGVPATPKRAASLYAAAAADTSGTTYIYSPAVGRESAGRVIPMRMGPDRPGLPEAKYRLGRLYIEGRGVPLSVRKGMQLLQMAADAGSAEAGTLLGQLAAP